MKYELLQELPTRTIFSVYRAKERSSGREVKVYVLKEPFNQESDFVDQLAEVAEQLKRVEHPNVEQVVNFLQHERTFVLVTQFAQGPTLEERIKRLSSFSVPVSLGLAISICEGLEALHRAGVVHGDVSSQNVVALPNGSVKLKMAGIWETYAQSETAGTEMLPAMAPYLAPEVTTGSMPSAGSDIYATGVLLYTMLVGRQPYRGDSAVEVAQKHISAPVPSVRQVNPSIPKVLEEIVKKAMAKSPRERYQSARDLMHDLRLLQDATRFGKSLTWPLTAKDAEEISTDRGDLVPERPKVKGKDKAKSVPKEDEEEDDGVPAWVSAFAITVAAAVLLTLGAWFYFNFSRPPSVPVPELQGMNQQEATALLSDLSLKLKVDRREPHETILADHIISSYPPANRTVRENSFVSVVVSSGSPMVEVPDIRELRPSDATARLAQLDLRIARPFRYSTNAERPWGIILQQSPAPGVSVQRESSVQVVVNSDTDAEPIPEVPPATAQTDPGTGDYQYRLAITMPTDLPTSVNTRVVMQDEAGERLVMSGSRDPGETFNVLAYSESSEATFEIYYEDQLVQTLTEQAQ
ncbi:MAG: protein kinase domain-containing protein [Fimbriimonadaceae bacterium]